MADIKDAVSRSKNMSAIRSCDTKPEMFIRKALYADGFRYLLILLEVLFMVVYGRVFGLFLALLVNLFILYKVLRALSAVRRELPIISSVLRKELPRIADSLERLSQSSSSTSHLDS